MLVIGNGRMITQDASNPFLENGAVAMDGNTIVMVGVTEEVKKVYPDAEFVDYAFQQKWKVIQKKKSRNNSEIWQRGICRWKTLYKQGKEEI